MYSGHDVFTTPTTSRIYVVGSWLDRVFWIVGLKGLGFAIETVLHLWSLLFVGVEFLLMLEYKK
jgi:hypothetical protein